MHPAYGQHSSEQEKNSWEKINLTLVLCQETNLNIFRHIFHFYEFTANTLMGTIVVRLFFSKNEVKELNLEKKE